MIPAPRDFLVNPALFGRGAAEWVQGSTSLEVARSRAARLQHECALRLRAHLERRRLTQGEYADMVGWSRGRLSRIMVGQVWVPLLDLEEILDSFGESVWAISVDMLPPEEHVIASRRLMAAHMISQGWVLAETANDEFAAYMQRLRDEHPELP